MKKQNLLLLAGLGYIFFYNKQNDDFQLSNQQNRDIQLDSNFSKRKEYILEDYEYYNDFLCEFSKQNDIYSFDLNKNSIFKLIKTDDNCFDFVIKYTFLTKLIKLNIIEFNHNKYVLNLKYRPNLIERVAFKLDNNEINIDFRISFNNKEIILEILNVNEIDDILTIIKNKDYELYENLKRNNYKLIFKNKF